MAAATKSYGTLQGADEEANAMGVEEGALDVEIEISNDEHPWHRNSSPFMLFFSVLMMAAMQVGPLLLLMWEVHTSKKHLMNCDAPHLGVFPATLCEWTKAYVRCFPDLAFLIALVVPIMTMLHNRMFYVLMRNGALLQFEKSNPLTDTLFRILLFSIFNAAGHFALKMYFIVHDYYDDNSAIGFAEAKFGVYTIAMRYMCPAAIFLIFFFTSYDVTGTIQPLMRYFEEDAEGALQLISKMVVLPETKVSRIVFSGLTSLDSSPSDDADSDTRNVYKELIERSAPIEGIPVLVDNAPVFKQAARMWPARVLLHPHLRDDDSMAFRRLYFVFTASCVCFMCLSINFVIRQIRKELDDIAGGQYNDIACLVAELLMACVMVGLFVSTLRASCWHWFS